jgi:putative toxin-antitoxin system antitoxin component (TIGR02293 family)
MMKEHLSSRTVGLIARKFKRYDVDNYYKLSENARNGVSPMLFYDFATAINMPDKTLAQLIHISSRTISNYKVTDQFLAPVQSEHLLKLVALYKKGEEIFGNIEEFNYWLEKPFWNTNERPKDWMVTPGGVDLLIEELTKLAYGDVV